MDKEIICNTLTEALDFIEKNLDDGVMFSVELAPSETEKAGDGV